MLVFMQLTWKRNAHPITPLPIPQLDPPILHRRATPLPMGLSSFPARGEATWSTPVPLAALQSGRSPGSGTCLLRNRRGTGTSSPTASRDEEGPVAAPLLRLGVVRGVGQTLMSCGQVSIIWIFIVQLWICSIENVWRTTAPCRAVHVYTFYK